MVDSLVSKLVNVVSGVSQVVFWAHPIPPEHHIAFLHSGE